MPDITTRPTGVERTFGDEEILVSKTDPKGHIAYINDVFLRVSAYGADELVGSPHNIIRHPDMPGGVYLLLWQTIQSGKEIFAYLNNLAKDGQNYWVIAHVTPTFDGGGRITGYHSNRRTPNREALPTVNDLYREMRALEAGLPGPKAAKASLEWLQGFLADRDQSYDEFVWGLINGDGPKPAPSAVRSVAHRPMKKELVHA